MPTQRLQYLINTVPAKLLAFAEEDFAYKPDPKKWSKKEIIEHLIDSAANNHQRFVRAQFEGMPVIRYDQDKWNAASYYNDMDSLHIIIFWADYNRHLIEVIKRIPEEFLRRKVYISDGNPITLLELIADYTSHMEHQYKTSWH